MSEWKTEHRAFAVEMFFKSQESYITTIRAFRKHFSIQPHKPVPTEVTVRSWVKNFRQKGVVNKIKPPGPKKNVRTPENIERVRIALQKSPQRSLRKHAASLNLNERTIRRHVPHRSWNYAVATQTFSKSNNLSRVWFHLAISLSGLVLLRFLFMGVPEVQSIRKQAKGPGTTPSQHCGRISENYHRYDKKSYRKFQKQNRELCKK